MRYVEVVLLVRCKARREMCCTTISIARFVQWMSGSASLVPSFLIRRPLEAFIPPIIAARQFTSVELLLAALPLVLWQEF